MLLLQVQRVRVSAVGTADFFTWYCYPLSHSAHFCYTLSQLIQSLCREAGPTDAVRSLSINSLAGSFWKKESLWKSGVDQEPGVTDVWESSFQKLSTCSFIIFSQLACEGGSIIYTRPEGIRDSREFGDLFEITWPKPMWPETCTVVLQGCVHL